MLLLHQSGSVKIGEVVRYTITYTPAHDRIIPSPSTLHLKIKNTSAIALRAAYVHGPYNLYCAAYPATFNPNEKFENPRRDGIPEFEPNLKAGGTFTTQLSVPEEVRQTAGTSDRYRPGHESMKQEGQDRSVTWIIEVTSQVIFSNSAVVHYEVLLGRDSHSLQLGFPGFGGSSSETPKPGQISDHQQSVGAKEGKHAAQPKGVYSRAIKVRVDDTASLWNTPRLPEWEADVSNDNEKVSAGLKPSESKSEVDIKKSADEGEGTDNRVDGGLGQKQEDESPRRKRQKKIHLVVLTHGLHSNLGADMLFLKESIDATAKQARMDARKRKKAENQRGRAESGTDGSNATVGTTSHNVEVAKEPEEEGEEDDDEEVIVRGFAGNVIKTEKGIKYLGKRLAKYVLSMTYPDQPYRPVSKKAASSIAHALKTDKPKAHEPAVPTHENSTIVKDPPHETKLAYTFTKISFIGHSLGGLIQMYAVAYIQKHSPQFFEIIEPINFIALASPFLGLSNENPLYIKFALDFGLVGRTGQDLGLTWRAPTLARSGWGAIVGNIGESAHKKMEGSEATPEAKPLLRILPTGPAHVVLKKFRNRTVYSNVVNDGIVPLRTSCLLFLDWSGLGRVQKARRENGLVGTMAGWGWAEITGANSSTPRRVYSTDTSDNEELSANTPTRLGHEHDVPQPEPTATRDDDAQSLREVTTPGAEGSSQTTNNDGPFANFMKFFQPHSSNKSQSHTPKHNRIYRRSQTLNISGVDVANPEFEGKETSPKRSPGKVTALEEDDSQNMAAPPKTTVFEAAGDLLKPPLPSEDFILDPQKRPRTIFHDRVYHPEDIPPPPMKKRPAQPGLLRRSSSSLGRTMSFSNSMKSPVHTDSALSAIDYDDPKTHPDKDTDEHIIDGSAMKVEEKIARAYHRDLSWRKVLVRLEPDAHNNLIVRRMFANAYGWPVVKHLCDTHFADSAEANTRDEDEGRQENAKEAHEGVGSNGEETNRLADPRRLSEQGRTDSERREATDKVPALHPNPTPASIGLAASRRNSYERPLSGAWSDSHWADSADDSDESPAPQQEKKAGGWNWTEVIAGRGAMPSPKGTDAAELDKFFGKNSKVEEQRNVDAARDLRREATAGKDTDADSRKDVGESL